MNRAREILRALPQEAPLLTREDLKAAVEIALSDLISRSTVNEEVLDMYADHLLALTLIHVRQGQPSNS